MKIHSVKKEDRGTYFCVADNGEQSDDGDERVFMMRTEEEDYRGEEIRRKTIERL